MRMSEDDICRDFDAALALVEAGTRITITRDGEPIAEFRPSSVTEPGGVPTRCDVQP